MYVQGACSNVRLVLDNCCLTPYLDGLHSILTLETGQLHQIQLYMAITFYNRTLEHPALSPVVCPVCTSRVPTALVQMTSAAATALGAS